MFNISLFKDFPKVKEKAFLQYYRKNTIKQMNFAVGCGIFIYLAFAFLDPWIIPEIKIIAWSLRFGVLLPCGIIALLIANHTKKDLFIQGAVSLLVFFGGIFIIAMIIFSRGTDSHIYYAGLMLVVFICYTFFQLRFLYASICGCSLLAFYATAVFLMTNTPPYIIINNLFFLASTNVFGMFAAYALEESLRKEYLQNIQIKKVNRKLSVASQTDSLTSIANRRFFDKRMLIEWNRCKRINYPISVIIFDVDFFKLFNDTLGHLAGDRCLQQIAEILKQNTRRGSDFVARYGGEEFIIIASYATTKMAKEIASRINKKVEEEKIKHPASKISQYVTVSAGTATTYPLKAGFSFEHLVKEADNALYRAKSNGRNRVETTEL